MRRQRLWPYFAFTGCFPTRDIESLSWYTYDCPYFIHLFVSSNYSERECQTQTHVKKMCPWAKNVRMHKQHFTTQVMSTFVFNFWRPCLKVQLFSVEDSRWCDSNVINSLTVLTKRLLNTFSLNLGIFLCLSPFSIAVRDCCCVSPSFFALQYFSWTHYLSRVGGSVSNFLPFPVPRKDTSKTKQITPENALQLFVIFLLFLTTAFFLHMFYVDVILKRLQRYQCEE